MIKWESRFFLKRKHNSTNLSDWLRSVHSGIWQYVLLSRWCFFVERFVVWRAEEAAVQFQVSKIKGPLVFYICYHFVMVEDQAAISAHYNTALDWSFFHESLRKGDNSNKLHKRVELSYFPADGCCLLRGENNKSTRLFESLFSKPKGSRRVCFTIICLLLW